jgi:hypothetical protein
MFGFLLKIVLVVAIVVGVIGFTSSRSGSGLNLPDFGSLKSQATQFDVGTITQVLGSQLDQLVTHTDRSPMVMGIDITNQSLEAMVDTIRSLPEEDLRAVRQLVCEPATASAK